MKTHDLDPLCAALAFAVAAMKSDGFAKDHAQRTAGLASLMKEFCCASAPGACADVGTMHESPTCATGFSRLVPEDKFASIDRMTTAIIRIMRETGGCLPQDLVARGFTPEEIDRHWRMAKALAHVELNMMNS